VTTVQRLSDATVVTTPDELRHAVERAGASGSIGLDTEFLRERTYRARLCLVQIADAEQVWLIDPLTDVDLSGLARLIPDPKIEILVHAGRQDFELFFDRFEQPPRNVYDVQIAAGFAGFGASLPYGRLVESVLGVAIAKGESYTEWCRRPLTQEQLTYAADDVRFLPAVATRLKERIESLGRTAWVAEEMQALEDPTLYSVAPGDAWRKVTGRGALSGRQMGVLVAVTRWREEVAAERDIPRGWVVKDPTLIEIARRAPTDKPALGRIRGLHSKEVDRSGRAILAAVQQGLKSEVAPSAPPPPRDVLARARMLSGLADALVRARCEQAEIATELVATRGELEAVLTDAARGEPEESRHRLLRGWRRDLAGAAVLELARGRIAVRAIDDPPYVEEVQFNDR
jgi:ribonuclease D